MGDIVLTTPVMRCLKTQLDCEIHFVVKKAFKTVVDNNSYIDQLHVYDDNLNELIKNWKQQKFDWIIDLHNNLRSFLIKKRLWNVPSKSFYKANIAKWKMEKLKQLKPISHIVNRYMDTVAHLGVKNDGKGLDHFINKDDKVDLAQLFPTLKQPFIAYAIGGTYATKRMPPHKIRQLCEKINQPLVLLGGPGDKAVAEQAAQNLPNIFHACGNLSVNQSVSVMQQSACVIAHDTGLMHIAAALKKPTVSIWGCTHPFMGMTPYMDKSLFSIIEVDGLNCRPCSKLGYAKCPKQHFNCMEKIDLGNIVEQVKSLMIN